MQYLIVTASSLLPGSDGEVQIHPPRHPQTKYPGEQTVPAKINAAAQMLDLGIVKDHRVENCIVFFSQRTSKSPVECTVCKKMESSEQPATFHVPPMH